MPAASTTSTALSARNTSRPIPRPIGSVTPGARNLSGASRNEIPSTSPSQVNSNATATADHPSMRRRLGRGPGPDETGPQECAGAHQDAADVGLGARLASPLLSSPLLFSPRLSSPLGSGTCAAVSHGECGSPRQLGASGSCRTYVR